MGMSLWKSAAERSLCEWILFPTPESCVEQLIVAGLKT